MPNPPAVSFSNHNSMRENYETYGVGNYYSQVAATYRNPHAEGVRNVVWGWMDTWWDKEGKEGEAGGSRVLDMAAGSGEVTLALLGWVERKQSGQTVRVKGLVRGAQGGVHPSAVTPSDPSLPAPITRDTRSPGEPSPAPSSNPITPILHITATDPYTSPAYTAQTTLPCLPLSFQDIANGTLPEAQYTHIICSYALHLVKDSSELFALLWELSTKSRYLVVIAPGKRPEIREGWGWRRWDVERWDWGECELVFGKCRGRIYNSVNCF
ncbi:hypothetical protein SpCBS45565_g04376 [Spizellomyces sp. 'palustris']|nr:hypothetical protein SpCBS45565_g04376 [Spizellomyces sp. 'palustris']